MKTRSTCSSASEMRRHGVVQVRFVCVCVCVCCGLCVFIFLFFGEQLFRGGRSSGAVHHQQVHVTAHRHTHGTSKIDALDDDQTPLRLTASQTATTRGVMVSGIMGALDIAPTLLFVEPRLKINGEQWTKVMDEYIAPNCAAHTELGRKFFFCGTLDTLRGRSFLP